MTGTKGYLWMERDSIADLESMTLSETFINQAYFEGLRLDAIKTIEKFGSYEDLVAR